MSTYYNQNQEFNPKKIIPVIAGVIAIIVLITFWSRITVTIQSGQAGVIFKQFSGGLDTKNVFGEGFHFIAPWNKMFIYDIRQQEIPETMNVLSSNGLEISVDISVWFRPEKENLGLLHSLLGEDYINKVVIPSIRSAVRTVVGRYTPEELYSTKREGITTEIYTETRKILEDKYIDINRTLIRTIVLPPTIKFAIENKLKQEQETLEYEFRLAKAHKEAERQRIEAEGKSKANKLISESLTDKILREKGIEATLELSKSPNTKVIVVGSGKNGMPLILNTDD
jgi:regulator of protease activity HflC (stomatin/prohibitin superfamily)